MRDGMAKMCYLTVEDIDRMLAVATSSIRDELLDLRNGERRDVPASAGGS